MSIPTNSPKVTYSFPVEKEFEPDVWDTDFQAGTFQFDLTPGAGAGLTPEIMDSLAEGAMDNYLSNLTAAISGHADYRVAASRSYTMPNQTGDTWPV